jgi:SAM-dependent methyltransferase
VSPARSTDDDLEHLRRLLGDVAGKRVLVLGADAGAIVALARAGATGIGLDPDAVRVDATRAAVEREELKAEVRTGDLADLAFLRADSIDVVVSAGALARLGELDRLFRQVQRVLRPSAPFAFTLPHPGALVVGKEEEPVGSLPLAAPYVARAYFDPTPVAASEGGDPIHPHTIESVFTGLVRAGFRIDVIGEPEPPRTPRGPALVPEIVVWRARKEGS